MIDRPGVIDFSGLYDPMGLVFSGHEDLDSDSVLSNVGDPLSRSPSICSNTEMSEVMMQSSPEICGISESTEVGDFPQFLNVLTSTFPSFDHLLTVPHVPVIPEPRHDITFLGTEDELGKDKEAAEAFLGRPIVLNSSVPRSGANSPRKRSKRNPLKHAQKKRKLESTASRKKPDYLPHYCSLQKSGKFLVQTKRQYTNPKNAARYTAKMTRHITTKVSLLHAMLVADQYYFENFGDRFYFKIDEAVAKLKYLPVEALYIEEMKANILIVTKSWNGPTDKSILEDSINTFISEDCIITAIKDAQPGSQWEPINMGHTEQNRFCEPESEDAEKLLTPREAKKKIEDSECELQVRFRKLIGGKHCAKTKTWLHKKVQEECKKMHWHA